MKTIFNIEDNKVNTSFEVHYDNSDLRSCYVPGYSLYFSSNNDGDTAKKAIAMVKIFFKHLIESGMTEFKNQVSVHRGFKFENGIGEVVNTDSPYIKPDNKMKITIKFDISN